MAKAAASGLVMMTSVRAGGVTEAEEMAVTDASTEKTDLSKNAGSTMMRNKYYRDVAHVRYVSKSFGTLCFKKNKEPCLSQENSCQIFVCVKEIILSLQ
jgi:hypothetical protein